MVDFAPSFFTGTTGIRERLVLAAIALERANDIFYRQNENNETINADFVKESANWSYQLGAEPGQKSVLFLNFRFSLETPSPLGNVPIWKRIRTVNGLDVLDGDFPRRANYPQASPEYSIPNAAGNLEQLVGYYIYQLMAIDNWIYRWNVTQFLVHCSGFSAVTEFIIDFALRYLGAFGADAINFAAFDPELLGDEIASPQYRTLIPPDGAGRSIWDSVIDACQGLDVLGLFELMRSDIPDLIPIEPNPLNTIEGTQSESNFFDPAFDGGSDPSPYEPGDLLNSIGSGSQPSPTAPSDRPEDPEAKTLPDC